jgi:membrane-associated protease RseP (regulator of RpoE activity)
MVDDMPDQPPQPKAPAAGLEGGTRVPLATDLPPGARAPNGTMAGELPPPRPTRTQILLCAATVVSMLIMYPLIQVMYLPAGERMAAFRDPDLLTEALVYTLTLLCILGVHEMGHFVVARRYRVDVSLPYIIPAPNMLGTFGAVIRIRTAITDRRALLMIGAAGPIAGFLVAVPAVVWGVLQSEVGPITPAAGPVIGGSLLFVWIIEALHGPLPAAGGLELSGMAFAGWAGLFLTAFNLLPIGQLDGGHVIYALLGPRTRYLALPIIILLVCMGVLFWIGWAVICLLVVLFGFRHPPVDNPRAPLAPAHRVVALATLIILILCFTPVPIISI